MAEDNLNTKMLVVRKADARGYFKNEWLTSHHTFSFSDYYDPKYMHFSHLRVINEDYIAPDKGFATHSHQDMEIMTYVISGELKHQDSMGNSSVIKSGEVQFMRAGTGVTHSEFNPSKSTPTHLLQIWIMPNKQGLAPTYAQNLYTLADKKDKLCLLASGDQVGDIFQIAQAVKIYASVLDKNSPPLEYSVEATASIWIQVVSGELNVNDTKLGAGDGASIQNVTKVSFSTLRDVEFLLFHFD